MTATQQEQQQSVIATQKKCHVPVDTTTSQKPGVRNSEKIAGFILTRACTEKDFVCPNMSLFRLSAGRPSPLRSRGVVCAPDALRRPSSMEHLCRCRNLQRQMENLHTWRVQPASRLPGTPAFSLGCARVSGGCRQSSLRQPCLLTGARKDRYPSARSELRGSYARSGGRQNYTQQRSFQ